MAGRPRTRQISQALNEILQSQAPPSKGGPGGTKALRTWAQALAERLVRTAFEGDDRESTQAIAEIATRTEGKPAQRLELGGDGSAGLTVNIKRVGG